MSAPRGTTARLGGWGNYPRADVEALELPSPLALERDPEGAREWSAEPAIARGMGRSYGDSALAPRVLGMTGNDRLLAFDDDTGVLVCEGGVTLDTIARRFVSRGWFLPVTPGTRFVTVGGAVASDVHGKNHHADGSFGDHVRWLKLLLADGSVVTCSPDRERELFLATTGGMGLTGVVLEVALRLRRVESPWMVQRVRRLPDLTAVMAAFEASAEATYSVAWIDCLKRGAGLGRSVFITGEHAGADEAAGLGAPPEPKRRSVPFFLPGAVLNPWSVRAFNALYHRRAPRDHTGPTPLDPFFYPLDAVAHWNRIYGRRGFVQYQFVIPLAAGREGLAAILDSIAASGQGSFLAVLKLCGPGNEGYLSFPMAGWSLALDFPATPRALRLLKTLDAMVREQGGRLYLTKDARMDAAMLEAGYPRLAHFLEVKRRVDPDGRWTSLQSRRLGLT
ncbi:MAG: FAD-binding protein [Pseudomonadota bacterium]